MERVAAVGAVGSEHVREFETGRRDAVPREPDSNEMLGEGMVRGGGPTGLRALLDELGERQRGPGSGVFRVRADVRSG